MTKSKTETINAHETLKIGLTAIATGAIWFYAGPVASIAAKEAFGFGYDLLYGIPKWYNPSYALTYLPLREHVAHYAFEYGGIMLGSICAPFIYKGVSMASNMGGKVLTHLGIGVSEEKNKTLLPLLQYSKKKKQKPPILLLADRPHTTEQDMIHVLQEEMKRKKEAAPITARF